MTEEMNENSMIDEVVQEDVPQQPDELTLLKQRADIMGLKYHPSIKADKLKEKIQAKQDAIKESSEAPVAIPTQEDMDAFSGNINLKEAIAEAPTVVETTGQKRVRLRKEATRLIRIRVTNMNPLKGNLKGEIFSIGNSQIGFIKKYVPFNIDQGWHVPQIILTHIKNKKYMTHYTVKIGNQKIKKHRLVNEYAVELLPPLTATELKDLGQRQLAKAE